jgi:hypothetical protein
METIKPLVFDTEWTVKDQNEELTNLVLELTAEIYELRLRQGYDTERLGMIKAILRHALTVADQDVAL